MSASHLSGPLTSTNGFIGAVTGNVTGEVTPTSQTLTGAGAINTTATVTNLVTGAGAAALTLAAPTVPGMMKIITLETDGGGDGTLASTNIVGQSSGTTSITFNDAGDILVLMASGLKWVVIKEFGVTAA